MHILQLELWQILVLFSPMLIIFWSLFDISKRTFQNPNEKFYWIVFCSLVPVIGTLIYIFFGIKRAKKL